VFEFKFSIKQFGELLKELATKMGTTVNDGKMVFNGYPGIGYLQNVILPNKLDTLIMDFDLTDDTWISRLKSNEEYYVFICEEIIGSGMVTKVDDVRAEKTEGQVANVYLVSFLSDLRQFASAGSKVSGIRVILSPEWMASYLQIGKMDEVLQRYLTLKAKSIHVREMDYETHKLLMEVINPPENVPMKNAYLQNRIMMILEIFFSWLSQQMSVLKLEVNISRDEIEKIMEVEKALLSNLAEAPTIADLSRMIGISPSKLKKQFRDMYGLPPYEYFQQHRMQKAREMLSEASRSVKNVGRELGYANLSNFTLAFRKVFHVNPGELRKKVDK
jgi:AraC-like DNA-binding protein